MCIGCEMMALDEAIQHCKEKAVDTPCGMEHAQLASWLEELKESRTHIAANRILLRGIKVAMTSYLDDHEHIAPDDCYATGPKTGDGWKDLVRCPGCTAKTSFEELLKAVDSLLTKP